MKHSDILSYLHQAYRPELVGYERCGDSLCLYSVENSVFNSHDFNQIFQLLGKNLGEFYFDSNVDTVMVTWKFFVLDVIFD